MTSAKNTLFEGTHYLLNFESDNEASFTGVFNHAVKFITEHQLYDIALWQRFVRQYATSADSNGGWRCEYWGKMMRGACFICNYTKDIALYSILESTITDMLEKQDSEGRFSTYTINNEFFDWDMWGRKYIMLGFMYFYEICDSDSLKERVIKAVCRHADYICSKVGDGEGKIPITKTSKAWLGANSMSILEPFVKLYHFTHVQKYFDFASHIVKEGYESQACIFRLAEEDKLYPFQYPENKAYETMSCFDGLAEYYCATGIEKYKSALVNFGKRLLESDVTVIGCCGCTHELFDNSTKTQTDDTYMGIMQETCVSVTLMKLCGQLLRVIGDTAFADCIEKTFFNAYLGSINTHLCRHIEQNKDYKMIQIMPFDSYSPLRTGVRGKKTGGYMVMADRTYYGCCACIGAAGAGYIPKIAVLTFDKGILLNMYLPGVIQAKTPSEQIARFHISGNYPYENNVKIKLSLSASEAFHLDLRIPEWSGATVVYINGKKINASGKRISILNEWKNGDEIAIDFDMRVKLLAPPDSGCAKYVAFRYGCIVLAADERLGVNPSKRIAPISDENRNVPAEICDFPEISDAVIAFKVLTKDGYLRLIDYSSAGKDYKKRFCAWIPVKQTFTERIHCLLRVQRKRFVYLINKRLSIKRKKTN